MAKVRRWLDLAHDELEGLTPEEAARTEVGFKRVKGLLQRMRGH